MKKQPNAIHLLQTQVYAQAESFVITTADGKIILVDGGHKEDAEYLLNYLIDLTGEGIPHIDAWFLTHAHSDHCSAFFEIVENRWNEIDVEKIYYNFPSVQYFSRTRQPDKDAQGTAAHFYSLLEKFADRICIVSGGDTYRIGDAVIEILYSPESDIEINICNNSSVAFKMTLGEKTALFLGDCGVEAGDRIMERYRDKLKSDICQMAHHGQNGVRKEFYELVRPEICLWCTPKWLWNNDVGKGFDTHCYKTVEVRGWMDEIGSVKKNIIDMDGTQICLL